MTQAVPAVSSAEREELRRAVAAVLADRCDESAVRAVAETESGYDPSLWTTLAGEIGIIDLLVPDGDAGPPGGIADLAVVLQETGRVLYPGPLLATAAATWALARHSPGSSLLADLAKGAVTAAVGVTPMAGHDVRIGRSGGLSGTVPFVLDGHAAGVVLVEADGLWVLETTGPGVLRKPVETLDLSRRFADLTLQDAPASRLAGPAQVAQLRSAAAVLVAAEQVGGAAAALRSTLDYTEIRSQFGRLIGSYQSIKHLCVDVLVATESARAAVTAAAGALDADADDAPVLASIAKAAASEAYVLAAETNVHIHGGIGYTWEHSAQLHLKRAKVDEVLFGDARWHRDRLGALLGIRKDTP